MHIKVLTGEIIPVHISPRPCVFFVFNPGSSLHTRGCDKQPSYVTCTHLVLISGICRESTCQSQWSCHVLGKIPKVQLPKIQVVGCGIADLIPQALLIWRCSYAGISQSSLFLVVMCKRSRRRLSQEVEGVREAGLEAGGWLRGLLESFNSTLRTDVYSGETWSKILSKLMGKFSPSRWWWSSIAT